jgi:hypothetical protein
MNRNRKGNPTEIWAKQQFASHTLRSRASLREESMGANVRQAEAAFAKLSICNTE